MAEPVEEAQLMTFSERQYRAREAKQQYTDGVIADKWKAWADGKATSYGDFRDYQPAQDYLSQAARRGFTDE
jgi:hypothetical protein